MNSSMVLKTEIAGSVSGLRNKSRGFVDYFIIGPENKINMGF